MAIYLTIDTGNDTVHILKRTISLCALYNLYQECKLTKRVVINLSSTEKSNRLPIQIKY